MILGLYYKLNHLQGGIKVYCFWHLFFFFLFLAVLHFDIFLSQLVFLLTDPKYHNGLVQRPQLASNFVLCWAFISVQLTESSSIYLCELARDGKTPLEFWWLRNWLGQKARFHIAATALFMAKLNTRFWPWNTYYFFFLPLGLAIQAVATELLLGCQEIDKCVSCVQTRHNFWAIHFGEIWVLPRNTWRCWHSSVQPVFGL